MEAHGNRSGEAEAEEALVEQVKQSAEQLRGMLTFVKPWSLHWQLREASWRELKGHQCAPQDGVVYMWADWKDIDLGMQRIGIGH